MSARATRAVASRAALVVLLVGCGRPTDAGPSVGAAPNESRSAHVGHPTATTTHSNPARPSLPAKAPRSPAPPTAVAAAPSTQAPGADPSRPPAADAGAGGSPVSVPALRPLTEWRADRRLGGTDRMAHAKRARAPIVAELFAEAGLAFPPPLLLFRVFKQEKRFEVWASTRAGAREPLVPVTSYEICAASGTLGPKRRQGDGQVPEGFYTVGYFSPTTPYHLAMQVSYPNESDRILGDKRDPGNEIMIHGDCVSAGCVALGDERSEELWVMATTVAWAGGKVHVHIFPSRDMAALLASGQAREHHAFWQNLAEIGAAFERDRRLPVIGVERDGRYRAR